MPYFNLIAGRFTAGPSVFAFLMLWLAVPGVAQVTFGNPSPYPVGGGPRAVVAGDFNGDGHADLATADATGDNISVLRGNGDGTFQPAVNYAAGQDPAAIVALDLNLDGKVDLAVAFHGDQTAQQTGGINLFLGNGDGTFQPAITLALDTYPGSLASGDFNGDGKPDLALTGIDPEVSVFLGNGDGTFGSPVAYGVTGAANSVAVGDFNGDGRPDLVVTTTIVVGSEEYSGKASVLLGNAGGSFQAAIETDLGTSAYSAAVGDFNGDHQLDLAFISKASVFSNPHVVVVLGNGNGTFGSGTGVDVSDYDASLTSADINADGLSDIVTVSAVGHTISVYLGHDDGSFEFVQTIFFSGFGPMGAAVSDFNGDLLADLAITMGPQNLINVVLNTSVDFGMGASALTPDAVNPGQSATATISTSAANGFSGTVSFTCSVSPLPLLAPQCSVNPGSVSAGTPTTVTVTTTPPQDMLAYFPPQGSLFSAIWLPISSVTLLGMVAGAWPKKRRWFASAWFSLVIAMALLLPGCGGSSGGNGGGPHGSAGTPAGNYTIIVTGTSGSTQHSTVLALTVK